MLIDLNELFKKDNNELEYNVDITFDKFESKLGSFEIKQKTPLHLNILHSQNRAFTVDGSADIIFSVLCDRCLEDVDVELNISISKKFDLEKEASAETEGESEESRFVTESLELDTEALVKDEILLLWPEKVLCKEDCKGLCNVCGHNLNVSDCGCDRVVLDPRMAAIQDIFKNAGN